MTLQTEARNATLEDLSALLTAQQAAKVDVVAPADAIRSEGGVLVVDDAATETVPDPVEGLVERRVPGRFLPTAACDGGISEKLGINRAYLRRLRNERPDLFDANVNGWLHGLSREQTDDERASDAAAAAVRPDGSVTLVPADPRKFLLRCFADPDGGTGIARAFLSDGFGFIDHLDVLGASLEGIQQAGADVKITKCDLTESRMYVVVEAPEITAAAPTWLAGYRSPFEDPEVDAQRRHGQLRRALEQGQRIAASQGHQGYEPGTEPIVHAGFVISNSETGGGAAQIVPRIVVRWCRNGATIGADALRRVHLGSRLEAGVVRWSEDTIRKNLELVVAQARDAVATFLDVDYLQMKIAAIEEKAAVRVTDAGKAVEVVTKQLGFGEDRIAGILDHFVRAGQMTAGGIMNAVTSYAQCVPDADDAHAMESKALDALDLAARVG